MAQVIGQITLDGTLDDWLLTDLLVDSEALPGFEIYGIYTGDSYVFAINSSSVPIGANTTLYLNTDQNIATGGSVGNGAEYFVNFVTDVTLNIAQPYLYDGSGNYIGPLDYAYSSDGLTVEFAIPKTSIGSPSAVKFVGDINDTTSFNNYPSGFQFTLSSVDAPTSQTVFGSVTVDGNLQDWTASNRLDYMPSTGQPNYETYGKYTGDAFVFAIKAPAGTTIGQNTTIWLDTDRNSSTGYQIFQPSDTFAGFGGAEFQVNIAPDNKAYLYRATGPNTLEQISTTPLSFAFDSTKQIWEVAIPTALLGSSTPQAIDVYQDVNNTTFLPGDYTQNRYTLFANPALPARSDASKKIGIVYSETTASKYFSKTAYSQLFMSIQDEAMMAGIPFDLLTEADLKDMNKLVNYDALVFPSFQYVNRADLQTIQDNLTNLIYRGNTNIITAGNFLTNDETGAILPDAYSRMKTLLNLQPTAFGTSAVSLKTGNDVTNSILQGYTAGETIRNYNNVGWNAFSSIDPSKSKTLATQTVNNGTQTYDAVVTTQTGGGQNVHFASESYLGDSNLLWQALQKTTYNNQPSIKLSLTRNNSLFLSRNDMDLSQESYSVKPEDGSPGVYDRMLPILEQWKAAYNFVGSYYINIGNNPAEGEYTNWSASKPYYDRLLAAGNEIGTHSYTHFYAYQGYNPTENTNVATDAQLKFEFYDSKQLIEQQLGIKVTGSALPGAPETVETAQKIIQYFDYISGGYSGAGAGYPNAFGYLTPDQKSVYLAPNLYFDFTLIQFGVPVYDPVTNTYTPQKLTADQAKAEWIRQFNEVTSHTNKPIVMMPWHDYGPTNWDNQGYTTDMFTGLIQSAYNSGAEFTTLDDASNRIKTFEQSKLFVDYGNNSVTATVAPAAGTSVGRFSLDLGTGFTIKSVNNWYAYDKDSVLLPANGGTFTINLGANVNDIADLTHITALPMRSELRSVSGNGEDLNFSFVGEGQVEVDLKNPTGLSLMVTGADSYSVSGEILKLNFNPLNYLNPLTPRNVTIDLAPYNIIRGTIGNDFLTATAAPDRILADAGNDTVNSTIVNAQQNDLFDGGTGTDTLVISGGTATTALTLNVATTANQLTGITGLTVQNFESFNLSGFLGSLNATGSTNNDVITAGAGNDTLNSGDGNDTLFGGAGNDFLDGGFGFDRIDGGDGTDTTTYAFYSGSISANLATGVVSFPGNTSLTDTLVSIENIVGAQGSDVMVGSSANNVISGGNGNDRLTGAGGGDVLTGGSGSDTFTITNRSDSLLANFDRVTDLQIGTDSIDGPISLSPFIIAKLGAVSSLSQTGIGSVLNIFRFGGFGAATFTYQNRTFLALNDGFAGFQERQDAVVEITGYTGNLSNLRIS